MLHVLTHSILPVFFMLVLGFVMGTAKSASFDEARAVNRIAFLVLQPPLIFMLLSGLDLESVRFDALLTYALCEVVGFLLAFGVARYGFRCGFAEAWLLGMTVIFVNSLLYVWPISTLIYGEKGAMPITAIVALDSSVTFGFFIISMEVISGKGTPFSAVPRIVRNPILIAIVVAITLNLIQIEVPEPIITAARFAGAGAAPMTLFALGVVLSSQPVRPNWTIGVIVSMKLIAFPLAVWAVFELFLTSNPWEDLFLLNAAGPSGAMAFSLALLHGVSTRNVAPIIIWTSALSLISLAWLA